MYNSLLMGVKNAIATLENSLMFPDKMNIVLPYNPAITLLVTSPTDLKTYVYMKTYMQMFRTTLFIITKNWMQSRCPLISE